MAKLKDGIVNSSSSARARLAAMRPIEDEDVLEVKLPSLKGVVGGGHVLISVTRSSKTNSQGRGFLGHFLGAQRSFGKHPYTLLLRNQPPCIHICNGKLSECDGLSVKVDVMQFSCWRKISKKINSEHWGRKCLVGVWPTLGTQKQPKPRSTAGKGRDPARGVSQSDADDDHEEELDDEVYSPKDSWWWLKGTVDGGFDEVREGSHG